MKIIVKKCRKLSTWLGYQLFSLDKKQVRSVVKGFSPDVTMKGDSNGNCDDCEFIINGSDRKIEPGHLDSSTFALLSNPDGVLYSFSFEQIQSQSLLRKSLPFLKEPFSRVTEVCRCHRHSQT